MDLEGLKEKLPRLFVLGTLAWLGYLGYDYYVFTNSKEESPLLMKQAEVASLQTENDDLKKKIQQAKEFLKTLDAKRQEIKDLAVKLSNLQATLNDDFDVPNLVNLIDSIAKEAGLKVTSIRPGSQAAQEYYEEQAFDLSFRGVYIQFLVFLQKISVGQRIIRVENCTINRKGPSTANFVEIEGSAQLKAYRYRASKEDDVAKGSSGKPAGGGK